MPPGHPNPTRSPAASGLSSMSVNEMKNDLNLSDDQTKQLTSILDVFSRYYDISTPDGMTASSRS